MALSTDVITQSFAGLTSWTQGITAAGTYLVQGHLSVPRIAGGAQQCAVVATISLNGTPLYTSPPGTDGFATRLECNALDTVTVALTSTNASDALPNVIKGVVSLG